MELRFFIVCLPAKCHYFISGGLTGRALLPLHGIGINTFFQVFPWSEVLYMSRLYSHYSLDDDFAETMTYAMFGYFQDTTHRLRSILIPFEEFGLAQPTGQYHHYLIDRPFPLLPVTQSVVFDIPSLPPQKLTMPDGPDG